MKRLYIPIVITPTLTLPRQRGRGIPGFPDGHWPKYLAGTFQGDRKNPGTIQMTIDRIGGGFLLLVGLFVAWERRVLPLGSQSHPGPGYFPLVLAILLIILGGLLLLRGGLAPAFRTLKWGEGRHAAAILGCSLFAS